MYVYPFFIVNFSHLQWHSADSHEPDHSLLTICCWRLFSKNSPQILQLMNGVYQSILAIDYTTP
jgi:hypothetical protein